MNDGDQEEAVAGVSNTGKGIVPRDERCQKTEDAARLEDRRIGGSSRIAGEVGDPQEEKGHVQSEEQAEECQRGLHCAEQQNEAENKPALNHAMVSI